MKKIIYLVTIIAAMIGTAQASGMEDDPLLTMLIVDQIGRASCRERVTSPV